MMGLAKVMENTINKVYDVYSHMVSVTPTESVTVSREHSLSSSMNVEVESVSTQQTTHECVETELNLKSGESSYTCEYPFMIKKHEPEECEPSLHRKRRGYFRTCSSNSLHILLNEVVLPIHCVEHMKILPPPTFIYIKTIAGGFIQKQVYMNGKGERYIFDDEMARVYLQDIKGLYRYNST
jgi:hypothetical protein